MLFMMFRASLNPKVIKSISAGMIAWLKTKGVHLPAVKRGLQSSRLSSQLMPGKRSFSLFLNAVLLISTPLWAVDTPALTWNPTPVVDSRIKIWNNLLEHRFQNHYMARQNRPIFIHRNRREDRNNALPYAVSSLGAVIGGAWGAATEPKRLTTVAELRAQEMAPSDLHSWMRPNFRKLSKGVGFASGFIFAGTAAISTLIAWDKTKDAKISALIGMGVGVSLAGTTGLGIWHMLGGSRKDLFRMTRFSLIPSAIGTATALAAIGLSQVI